MLLLMLRRLLLHLPLLLRLVRPLLLLLLPLLLLLMLLLVLLLRLRVDAIHGRSSRRIGRSFEANSATPHRGGQGRRRISWHKKEGASRAV
jgi:hypothetical protein